MSTTENSNPEPEAQPAIYPSQMEDTGVPDGRKSPPESGGGGAERRREIRIALTLASVISFRMLGLFLLLPVFMLLAADIPGFTPQMGGVAVGIYGLTQALLQQPFGWLSDRWGRRPVILLGLALFALGGIVAAMADSMSGLVLGRAFQGCGAIAGTAMAFAADLTRPQYRSISMAIIGMAIGGAFLLSMVVSVPLALLLGLGGLFWLTAGLGIFGMLLVLATPGGNQIPEEDPDEGLDATVSIRFLAVSVFMLHAVLTLLFVVVPPMLADEYLFALSEHWKVYVPAIVLSVLVILPLLRRVGKEGSEGSILHFAFLTLAVSIVLMASGLPVIGLGVGFFIFFAGFNLLEASMPSLLSRISGTRGRGRKMGLYSTFQFLGAFAGGVAGGSLLAWYGSQAALWVTAVSCLLWGAVLYGTSKRNFPTGMSN